MYSLLFHSCELRFEFLFKRGAFGSEFQRSGSKTALIVHSGFTGPLRETKGSTAEGDNQDPKGTVSQNRMPDID